MTDMKLLVDDEFDRYEEAGELEDVRFPRPDIIADKVVLNRSKGVEEFYKSMSSGGFAKIGERQLDLISELKRYDQTLRDAGQTPSVDDYYAFGADDDQILQAGLQPQQPEPSERKEPLTEFEQLYVERQGEGLIAPREETLRERGTRLTYETSQGELRQIFKTLGIDEFTARQIAEGIWGNPESTKDLGIGIADFTPAGMFFGAEEGMNTFERGINSGDPMTVGVGALEAGLSFLEAIPATAAGAKALKRNIPAFRQALEELGVEAQKRIDAEGTTLFSNPVRPIVDRGLAAAGRLVAPKLEDGLPGRISTRLPTAKAATEDPMTGELIVGLEEMKTEPALYEFNVNITKDYPNMQTVEGESVDETAERFIEHVKDNLLYIHDKVPADTRVRSQKWYDGARAITDRWSEEYGVPDTSIAGALAALSPQKDWYQNVSLAQRVLDVAVKRKDFVFANEMEQTFRALPSLNKPKYEPMLKAIKGKSYAEIVDEDPAVQATLRALFVRLYDQTYNKPDYQIVGPEGDMLDFATTASGARKKAAWGSLNEIGKAVASIDVNGDVNTISRLMGERHKVRNFYNNIYDPNSPFGDVTIDTHAVAAGLLRPLSGNSLEVDHNFKNMSVKGRGTTKGSAKSGVSGNYGLYAEAYRRAAAERGILPRQMQSITWEAVRGLFTDKFKQSAKNVADIDAIWQRYKDGEIDLDETRRLVDERAGGINPPSWE
jgi:hypothetical protein